MRISYFIAFLWEWDSKCSGSLLLDWFWVQESPVGFQNCPSHYPTIFTVPSIRTAKLAWLKASIVSHHQHTLWSAVWCSECGTTPLLGPNSRPVILNSALWCVFVLDHTVFPLLNCLSFFCFHLNSSYSDLKIKLEGHLQCLQASLVHCFSLPFPQILS